MYSFKIPSEASHSFWSVNDSLEIVYQDYCAMKRYHYKADDGGRGAEETDRAGTGVE